MLGASPAGRAVPACAAPPGRANPPASRRFAAARLAPAPWLDGVLNGGRVAIAVDGCRIWAKFCALPPPRNPKSGREAGLFCRIAADCIPVIPARGMALLVGLAPAMELKFGCLPPIGRAALMPAGADGRLAPTDWPPP